MIVKELFVKPIDRDIQGVIKVGQTDASYIQQELEEYVVTNELKKHFKDFFSHYIEGIAKGTDKTGVWISGFFGSGKSHFLKILSYILENREAGGKKALDYFVDGNKIDDSFVIADMTRAASEAVNTDVVLFNIDSKNSSGSGGERDSIVSVFLRVFNEMQGFCGPDPYVASLERYLDEQNKLDEFKKIFQEKEGTPWDEARYDVGFIQDSIIDAITQAGIMSSEAAHNWCEKISTPYTISPEDFAILIKKYLDRKGKNHRIVFMVDEMGQFIGQDSRLMLNLQTLVEDLGSVCLGRAWVIVTSQEDIDSITRNMAARSNDFSKIQGRFDTRLSLSSSDVGEVIRKRILEKTEPASQTLSLLYNDKATVIRNLIVFNDAAQKKLYENAGNFASDYPFVPYQFDLLGNVLTEIRLHGASGKHLAMGERSMIALFKESAMRLSAESIGPLVPFNLFYDALDQFLDSGHRGVIQAALRNDQINPSGSDNCLTVDVLKTLFLIKYVKEITATIENITSLMCASINTDRLALARNIQEALGILIGQTLVSKNGDMYIFLTNEEQEVNREIERQNVSSAEVIKVVSDLLFDDIIGENKYRLSKFGGRYNFSYNQIVDDHRHNPRQSYPITLQILTPNSGQSTDTASLHMKSSQVPGILVVFPPQADFFDELQRYLKIERYIRSGAYRSLHKAQEIEMELHNEINRRKTVAKSLLEDALREARIFVNGNEESAGSRDSKTRIRDALETVINSVYHKLSYIDT
ncbi:MAG: BREX system P-loop protein BrxC, partial [Treponema sp.]|nr:BREX system P-loop protein BrxC [Treponema sp.]